MRRKRPENPPAFLLSFPALCGTVVEKGAERMSLERILKFSLDAAAFALPMGLLFLLGRLLWNQGKAKWTRELPMALFVTYLAALLKITAIRQTDWLNLFGPHTLETVQLIPLLYTWRELENGLWAFLYPVLGNLLWFVPLGFFLRWLWRRITWQKTLKIGAILSLGIELCQWLLQSGISDIDDVIFNSLGALLGWSLFGLWKNFCEKRREGPMKKFFAIFLSFLLLCGCQKAADAAEVTEALCRLYVHADTAVSSILEDWDTQSVKESIGQQLEEQLKQNLEAMDVEELPAETWQTVVDAMMEARSRIPLEVTLLESDKETATVRIEVGYMDISAIDAQAAQAALEVLTEPSADTKEYRRLLVDTYLEKLIEGLKEAECSEEKSSFELQLVKEKGLWMPEDLSALIEMLGQQIWR